MTLRKGMSCLILSVSALASLTAHGYTHKPIKMRPVVSLGVGPDAPLFSDTAQNLMLLPPNHNQYTSSNAGTVTTVGTAFAGVEFLLSKEYFWQLGASYYYMGNYRVDGEVSRFINPSFSAFSYTYQINTQRVMVESKLMATWNEDLHPYVTAGIGSAFNESFRYQEYTNWGSLVTDHAPFTKNTTTNFSGSLGAGADLDLSKHIRIGFKYLHSWLGGASLGPIVNQPTPDVLFIPDIKTNEFIFQGTYVF